jgi:electron transfer flavoprotein beta subunit
VHVQTSESLEPLYVARLLLSLAQREVPRLVILGKQSIDDEHGQTGPMLAALWQRPQATYGSKLELDDTVARVTREVDAGLETLDVDLPAVVTTDLRLNQPRYVKLPEILKAKHRPLTTLTPADLGVTQTARMRTLKIEPPMQRHKGFKVRSVAELIAALEARGLL